MLEFLFKKETMTPCESLNSFYSKLKEMYPVSSVTEERCDFIQSQVSKFGYLPYSHIEALEELTNAEILCDLEKKWELNGIFSDGGFNFTKSSVLARNNVKDSSWLQKEGHDIKLVNYIIPNSNKL